MECFYDHDPVLDLVALTVSADDGRQLTTLLDLQELAELAAETVPAAPGGPGIGGRPVTQCGSCHRPEPPRPVVRRSLRSGHPVRHAAVFQAQAE
jgi:hypothetical protein